MMSEKIELKEKLAAVDLGAKSMWDEMDDEQRKSLKQEYFILNRYVSNVKGQPRETQEHFVLTVNEFFNKYWNDLSKHPKLMWQLLCMSSHETKKIYFHEWIGFKKKKGDSKRIKFLEQVYPQRKSDEIDLLATMMTLAELKTLAEDHGYSKQEISKMF
jgi:hypothetical protein